MLPVCKSWGKKCHYEGFTQPILALIISTEQAHRRFRARFRDFQSDAAIGTTQMCEDFIKWSFQDGPDEIANYLLVLQWFASKILGNDKARNAVLHHCSEQSGEAEQSGEVEQSKCDQESALYNSLNPHRRISSFQGTYLK